MIIKVEIQLKMHAIFHLFKNKVHQNNQAIDLTWHNVMVNWNFQPLEEKHVFSINLCD
jgi:hypothetical protein